MNGFGHGSDVYDDDDVVTQQFDHPLFDEEEDDAEGEDDFDDEDEDDLDDDEEEDLDDDDEEDEDEDD